MAGDQSRQSGKPVDKRVSELSVKPATPQSRASESTDECHDSYGESDGEGDTDDEHGGEEEVGKFLMRELAEIIISQRSKLIIIISTN